MCFGPTKQDRDGYYALLSDNLLCKRQAPRSGNVLSAVRSAEDMTSDLNMYTTDYHNRFKS